MDPMTVSILAVYLGAGAIYITHDGFHKEIGPELQKQAPELPTGIIAGIAALGMVFFGCIWPIMLLWDVLDALRNRKK